MPLYTIDKLNASLKGGARSDKYFIEIGSPVGVPGLSFGEDDLVLCNIASFPPRNLGEADVWVQGRKLKIPGDSIFDQSWNIEFYNTPQHDNRSKFLEWMNAIDTYINNHHTCHPEDFMVTLKIHQVNCEGKAVATYEIYNAWPSVVGAIDVGADKINQIETFSVEFTYSHWDKVAAQG